MHILASVGNTQTSNLPGPLFCDHLFPPYETNYSFSVTSIFTGKWQKRPFPLTVKKKSLSGLNTVQDNLKFLKS